MNHQSLRAIVSFLVLSLLLLGCSRTQPVHPHFPATIAPNSKPIEDSAPYWCDFVPKKAFSAVTGIHGGIYERREGWLSYTGLCLVYRKPPIAPLSVRWAENGLEVIQRQEKFYGEFDPLPLASNLGRGFTVNAPDPMGGRPFYVIAAFRCGRITPWLSIDLSHVAAGRNATQDLSDLMRIAETRFGALHQCTPKPL